MSKGIRTITLLSIAFLIVMFTACAPAKKNPYYEKKRKSSRVDASQLGRNKYFFSSGYQKKLNKNYKKKRN
jgi:hypothetical protein